MSKPALNKLLQHPGVWRANQINAQHTDVHTVPTGFSLLDEQLQHAGWPKALIEVLLPTQSAGAGLGELRLLIPALRKLTHTEARWVTWINPPFTPYAPALQSLGIDCRRILIVHTANHGDALWAIERACVSGHCSSLLAWLDERRVRLKDTQRIQVAARQGGTLTCLFRPDMQQSSMAEVRIAVRHYAQGELSVDIRKRRGGWPLTDLQLPLAETTATQFRTAQDIKSQLNAWQQQYDTASQAAQAPVRQWPIQASTPTTPLRTPAVH